jgi:hypothetical protein
MTRSWSFVIASSALVVALAIAGCGQPAAPNAAPEADGHAHGAAEHPEEGPHHGHLIELGADEYHAELTHDDATKTVTVYLLDGSAKAAVPIAAPEVVLNLAVAGKPLQVKLAAAPQEGDPAGQASRFSLVDKAALEALEAPTTTGRLNVNIGDKSYSGAIEHHDHDHDHAEHGH